MQLLLELPNRLADAAHCTPDEFVWNARLALAAKLYEMGQLSSGLAAQVAQMPRVAFLYELSRMGVALIDLSADELRDDVSHA